MGRTDEIKAVLKEHGPMSARQIGEKLDMTRNAVSYHIGVIRKHAGGIRIHSYDRTCVTKKERLYEISDAKDFQHPSDRQQECALKKVRHTTLTHDERAFIKYLKSAAAQIQPFRDPMLFMTAGRAP